jgi:pilus assembly protein Flp/PilA
VVNKAPKLTLALRKSALFRAAAAQSEKSAAAAIREMLSALPLGSARHSDEGVFSSGGHPRVSKIVETFMNNLFSRFVRDESGATAIEYGLIAALIAVVVITALTSIGTNLSAKFQSIATSLR